MNIKSLLKSSLLMLLVAAVVVSCGDDDDPVTPTPTAPSVSAPSAQNVLVGESVDLTFNVTASGGFASATANAENGSATISSQPSSGATSGSVEVSFTANSAGAGSVTVNVTDADGLSDDATAVISITVEESTIRVVENITSDTVWESGKTYILGGRIAVEDGVNLTIEGGTVVKGEAGTGSNATALLVARGGTINANGTASAPIIFTSVADEITPEQVASGDFTSPNLDPDVNGLWGGVIVLGNAPISASTVPTQIEGIPASDTNGLYGGDSPDESSGSITYISIRHGGANIGEGNEINGLSLGGVGSGTVVENIEVVANQDDGIEWFGGNVNVTNILTWNVGDDGLDTDQDWIGTASNFITVTPNGHGFELDGPEGTLNRGCFTITNGIVYAGDNVESIVDFDDNTNGAVVDVYFFGFSESYSATEDFSPVASFGGDGNCASANWEYTLAEGGAEADQIFTGVPVEALTEVPVNGNSVGPNVADFAWTWASQSGALSSIGLE